MLLHPSLLSTCARALPSPPNYPVEHPNHPLHPPNHPLRPPNHPFPPSSPFSVASCPQPSHPSIVPPLVPSSLPFLGGHLPQSPLGFPVRRGAVGGQERGPRRDRVGEVKRRKGGSEGGREGGRERASLVFVFFLFLSLCLTLSRCVFLLFLSFFIFCT